MRDCIQVGKLEQKHREAKSALDEELRAFEVRSAGLADMSDFRMLWLIC